MIRYLNQDELARFPRLRDTMFADRAAQFRDRLGWPVAVDGRGAEHDEYDDADALYVIWQAPDGRHAGSMRFRPTTRATMVNDHFAFLADGHKIVDAAIWECTRLCLAPGAGSRVSAALMVAGSELGLGKGLTHAVGVFDDRMVRIYRRLGWGPIILGAEGEGRARVSLGLWEFSEETHAQLCERAKIAPERSRLWFDRAFDPTFGRLLEPA